MKSGGDFLFCFDDKTYRCPVSYAVCYSSLVKSLVERGDYKFTFAGLKDPHNFFNDFLAIIDGYEIEITMKSICFFNEVAKQLQIQSLFRQTQEFLQSIQIKDSNVFQILENFAEYNVPFEPAISFIIANWPKYEKSEKLLSLSLNALNFIFLNEKFQPSSETERFNIICKLVGKDKKYASLFSSCFASKLNREQMMQLLDQVAYDSIPTATIKSLKQRFILDVDPSSLVNNKLSNKKNDQEPKISTFQPKSQSGNVSPQNIPPKPAQNNGYSPAPTKPGPKNESIIMVNSPKNKGEQIKSEFQKFGTQIINHNSLLDEDGYVDGCISFLQKKAPADWINCLKCSCGGDKENILYHLFDYGDNIFQLYWDNYSKSGTSYKNAWVNINFVYHELRPTDYTIGIQMNGKKNKIGIQPKSWDLYGINSENKLERIGGEKNSRAFIITKNDKGDGKIVTFKAKSPKFYSGFQIKFTENSSTKNLSINQEIRITTIEFYGELRVKEQ